MNIKKRKREEKQKEFAKHYAGRQYRHLRAAAARRTMAKASLLLRRSEKGRGGA
jgi:hypothetical protein